MRIMDVNPSNWVMRKTVDNLRDDASAVLRPLGRVCLGVRMNRDVAAIRLEAQRSEAWGSY